MTNNGTGKTGQYDNIVYDSGNDANRGRKRIPVSATEVELLNDIPPPTDSGITNFGGITSNQTRQYNTQTPSSSVDKQKQQNNYQTLSLNRGQPKPNFIYQDENDQQLGSAVDKLLDKYAPDANPRKTSDNANNHRLPHQVNVVTARDEPSFSTFQTNTSPPSTTTSNSYSTIIRPKTGQIPQSQPQINPYNNVSNQQKPRTRPATTYDSFQHVIPPQQQQQQQPQQQLPKAPISVKTKNGNVAVVPGKLYNIDDDPLYILYDRQNVNPQNMIPKNTQKSASTTVFQPSSNFQTDPLSILYSNTSQRYPQQSTPRTTTIDTSSNGPPAFDLGNLIRRVQEDYFREVQPFVTSVRFVEKDHEFGQGVNDIGFSTPVTVEKGFTGQADDILRRSFGRPNGSQPPVNRSDQKAPGQGGINNQHPTLTKFDSKQSFTSVTSVTSTDESDDDDDDENYPTGNNRKKKVELHSQGTSPPPRLKQTQTQTQIKNPLASSINTSNKPITKHESDDDEETTTVTQPVVTKLAKRISPDNSMTSSANSVTSDDHDEYSATYNEHEHTDNSRAQPTAGIPALVKNVPLSTNADLSARERANAGNQVKHSEDIHPTPPTIRPAERNSRTVIAKSDSEKSDSIVSGSDVVSDSDTESKSAAYKENPQSSTAGRSTVPQVPYSVPGGRDANPPSGGRDANPPSGGRDANPPSGGRDAIPPSGGRDAIPPSGGRDAIPPSGGRDAIPPSGGRDANPPQTNARVTAPPNPSSTARTTTETNARQVVASGANPNIPFIAPDARNPTNDRNASAPAAASAQTGSTRFFQKDGDGKFGGKHGSKDGSGSIGTKIKSLFRGKKT